MDSRTAATAEDLPEPEMPGGKGYPLVGLGSTTVEARPEAIWSIVMDETRLAETVPGARSLRRVLDPDDHAFMTRADDHAYAADVAMGVGPLKATYLVEVALTDREPVRRLRLAGGARGPFGASAGEGFVALHPVGGGTRIDYRYAILITGRVASVGGRLVDGLADTLIERFFRLLSERVAGETAAGTDAARPAVPDAPEREAKPRAGLGRFMAAVTGGRRRGEDDGPR